VTARRGPRAPTVLVVIGLLVLVIAHVVGLRYGASHLRLPMLIGGGVLALIVMLHLGLNGKVRRALRDRARNERNR
jgi:hypothetical protein